MILQRRGVDDGVSLVESLLVLAVSAIVLVTAAPAIGGWVRDLEVRSSAAALLAALQAARAEAVARNAEVQLAFGDEQGHPGWRLSCVRVTAQCPATLRQQPIRIADRVRWAAVSLADMPAFNTALRAGAGLPGSVRFDALGAAPAVAAGVDVARIDILHADTAVVRRQVLLIAAQGMVRLCDPAAATDHPQHCH